MSSIETVSYWLIFRDDHLLVMKNHSFLLPQSSQLGMLSSALIRQHELGLINGRTCHCAELAAHALLTTECEFIPVRKAFNLLGLEWFPLIAKAKSVITWDKNHQYCGRCGHVTTHDTTDFERKCPDCRLTVYPRISPCIIVLIKKADHLLMARSPHFTPGAYGLIAGFVEAGETLEETVYREVKEEVGIQIKNIQYFGSQPWPFPDSLMIGFIAEYAGGEITIDDHEIESANWYHYTQLPGGPSVHFSIARKLIDHFISEQKILSQTPRS